MRACGFTLAVARVEIRTFEETVSRMSVCNVYSNVFV